MECPNCGHTVNESAEYCESCGYPLKGEVLEQTVVVPQAMPQGYDSMETSQLPDIEPLGQGPIMAPVAGRMPGELDEQLREKRRRGRNGVLIALLVIALLGAAAYLTWHFELWGGKTVPQVVGMSQESATALLEHMGLEVLIQEELSDAAIGTVTRSDPAPATRSSMGQPITLTIAKARVIPEVHGLTFEEAATLLAAQGAVNIQASYAVSNEPEGTVIAIEPAEGQSFAAADQITITVAQAYTVPNVVGKKMEEAIQDIEAAGLGYRVLRVSSPKESNTVVSTAPSPGTKLKQGDIVELSVASPNPDKASYLVDYLAMSAADIKTYLDAENAVIENGAITAYDNVYARYRLINGDYLTITDNVLTANQPEASEQNDDPLSSGKSIAGARYDFIYANPAVEKYDLAGVQALLDECHISARVEGYVTEESFELLPQANEQETRPQHQEESVEGDGEYEPREERPFDLDAEEFEELFYEFEQMFPGGRAATNITNNDGTVTFEMPTELVEKLTKTPFICAHGKEGDKYTWVAFISKEETFVVLANNNAFEGITDIAGADLSTGFAVSYMLGGFDAR